MDLPLNFYEVVYKIVISLFLFVLCVCNVVLKMHNNIKCQKTGVCLSRSRAQDHTVSAVLVYLTFVGISCDLDDSQGRTDCCVIG